MQTQTDRQTDSRPYFTRALFDLGQTVATPAALDAVGGDASAFFPFILRHHAGDWGELTRHGDPDEMSDWERNDLALLDGGRLLSAYLLPDGVKLWIITEADRSATTVLLPSDY